MLQFTDSNQNHRICPILQMTDKVFLFFFLTNEAIFFFLIWLCQVLVVACELWVAACEP